MIKKKIVIINKLGLHARAAAKFVQTASNFDCTIDVMGNDKWVNGKSIMGMMMLAAAKDNKIEICCDGLDENAAITQLEKLIQNRFGEAE